MIALIGLAAIAAGASPSGAPPVYTCPRVTKAPVIDGRLDDPAWKLAPVVTLVDPVKGGKCAQTTTARMCWDDKCLYVAFDCADKDILATMTKRDDLLFREEVVEVFLEPNGDPERYFEIEVSPRNVIFDATIINTSGLAPDATSDFGWNCKALRTAVVVDGTLDNRDDIDRAWTVELAIPFRSLGRCTPKPGEQWRGNLYRIDRFPPPMEFQAWSPTLRATANFHVPKQFGTIVFSTEMRACKWE